MLLADLRALFLNAVLLTCTCTCKAAGTPKPAVVANLPSGGIYSLMDLHTQPSDGLDSKASLGIGGNNTHRCFPLQRSRYCGAGFENYYMSVLVTVGGKHVSNADELDSVMDTYFDSPEEQSYINRFFGCQAWSGRPTPRFRIAYTCRSLLESHEATVCNSHHRPPALCADACTAYIDEWAMLTQNTSMCTNTTTSELRRASLAESCSAWPYNGTNAAGCVSSTESGAEVCGFPVSRSAAEPAFAHDMGRLCGFCKGTKDSCCRGAYVAEKCGQKSAQKRMVFYLALTVSMSAVLVLFITAASVWYMCSTRKARGSLLTSNEDNRNASAVSIKGADSAKGKSRDTLRRTTSLVIDSAIREFNGCAISPAGSLLSGKFCTQSPEGDEIEQSTQSSSAQSFVQQQRRRSSDKQTGFSQITSYLHIGAAYLLQRLSLHRFHSKRHNPSRQECEGTNDQQCHPKPESVVGAGTPSSVVRSTEEPHIGVADDGPESIRYTFKVRSQSLRGHPKQTDHDMHNVASGEMEGDDASSMVSPSELFTVLYPYSPVEDDELQISPGEQVHIIRLFSDGWVFVRRENDGEIGAIPAVCLDSNTT